MPDEVLAKKRRGRPPGVKGKKPERELTQKQREFIRNFTGGMSARAAAALAGYSDPAVDSWRQRHNPMVRAKMFQLRENKIDQLASVALKELGEILRNPDVPAKTRASVAQFLLVSAGHGPKADKGRGDQAGVDIRSMSLAELERYVAQRFDKTAKVGEGSTLDQEPIGPDGPMAGGQHIDNAGESLATAANAPASTPLALPAPPIEQPGDAPGDAADDVAAALPPPA